MKSKRTVYKIKSLFSDEKFVELAQQDCLAIESISYHMKAIREEVSNMINARKQANRIESERQKAISYHDTVYPCMILIRDHIDSLELMIDDEMWSLPKYRELLFIR